MRRPVCYALVTFLAACTPEDEPVHVGTVGHSPGTLLAIEGEWLWVFHAELEMFDLITGEHIGLGAGVSPGHRVGDTAAAGGFGLWLTAPPEGSPPHVGRVF